MSPTEQKWFVENEDKQLEYRYAINDELFTTKSTHQDIKVVDTKAYGRMLIIDDFTMLTETDEFVYHEMISHIPVLFHRNPEKVAVIGGGDGGTVTELVKHDVVKEITLCEIDDKVVSTSKTYFPNLTKGLDDPRVTVKIGDGIGYVSNLNQEVDLIIVDSTDPIGPGEGLFTADFYRNVSRALRPGGMLVAQSESPWGAKEFVLRIANNIRSGFKVLKPYIAPIPTYPRGLWSWTLACQSEQDLVFHEERFLAIADSLRYLSRVNAQNPFDLPPFYRNKLEL